MHHIAQDTSPEGMARANEVNQEAFWRYVVAQCGGTVSETTDLFAFATGIPIPFFNGVCRSTLPTDDADERIAFVRDWLRQRGVPGTWVVGPSTRPEDLGERLLRHGFAQGGETPGMALDLDLLAVGPPPPKSVTIERVRTREELHIWNEVSLVGFGAPPALMEPSVTVLDRLDPGDEAHFRCYVARLDGQPVGTSSLFMGAGVAGIYSVATLPEARHQGIGSALTVVPLQEARSLGYRIAILQASGMGYPIYRRMGFEEYQRYLDYIWEPE